MRVARVTQTSSDLFGLSFEKQLAAIQHMASTDLPELAVQLIPARAVEWHRLDAIELNVFRNKFRLVQLYVRECLRLFGFLPCATTHGHLLETRAPYFTRIDVVAVEPVV